MKRYKTCSIAIQFAAFNLLLLALASCSEMASNTSHYVTTLAGIQMPKLIYGTAWKKDATTDLVMKALQAGFRGIDTACQPKHYNEPGVGAAVKKAIADGLVKREDLFIQTKFTSVDGQDPNRIPYDPRAPLPEQVEQSVNTSLQNFGTTYIDSLVLHSPMRTHTDTMTVWHKLETFVEAGQIRQLGVSNCYDLHAFKKIYDAAKVKPAVIQNRFYKDSGYDVQLREFAKQHNIHYQSFWTLTANPHVLSSRAVMEMAKSYGKTVEQVFFSYLIHYAGIVPLTGTKNEIHMKQDLECLDFKIKESDKGVFDAMFRK